ncbi:metal ABC transporter permease [Polycladidibacter stylochi]|uniref:metal ABC transporter permease n=1 Tax=Polycladidibacter stylochi TaxID=1807766 RepID=UPI00082C9B98|nr:metal ABC transporter permease [Pseudovibrio stylochi]
MLNDFFFRAIIAGCGIALFTGPLGCFVVWRKMAYFGDTMSHSALLGVALALIFQLNILLCVLAITIIISFALLALKKNGGLSTDSLLGILAHGSLAIGLLMIATMENTSIDLQGLLFGDILSVSKTDILIIYLSFPIMLLTLKLIWRPLLCATLNQELAEAEGQKAKLAEIIFLLIMAATIAISLKIVGVLLITAMLIIPAASARFFARTPEQMALLAVPAGIIAVISGLQGSLLYDSPSGPSIVAATLIVFIIAMGLNKVRSKFKSAQ